MNDIFRPPTNPARHLYDVFQAEAEKRGECGWPEWNNNEIAAVFVAAVEYAKEHGLRAPTYQEVCDAERSASGHVDYGSKWAYRVAEKMTG